MGALTGKKLRTKNVLRKKEPTQANGLFKPEPPKECQNDKLLFLEGTLTPAPPFPLPHAAGRKWYRKNGFTVVVHAKELRDPCGAEDTNTGKTARPTDYTHR